MAVAERPPTWTPSPVEVARILEPPLERVPAGRPDRDRRADRSRDWPLRYGAYPVATGDGDELLVWGATARILGQLGAIIGGA